jgi:hypothetical protein
LRGLEIIKYFTPEYFLLVYNVQLL